MSMGRLFVYAATAALTAGAALAQKPGDDAPARRAPRVLIATTMGNIVAEVDTAHAPITGGNFLRYVDGRFFDGGSFGRTVTAENQPNDSVRIAVVQASIARARSQEQFPPIVLERTKDTGLRHVDGALSMGRNDPNTARSSFFICVGEQPALDFGGHRNVDGQGFGAFGRVVSGMEVVRRINAAPADGQSLVPPIRIDSIVRVR
jgi:peptidyl-prolyl cis-trans isomerase A (cyclophilin A)